MTPFSIDLPVLIHTLKIYEKVYGSDLSLTLQTDLSGSIREFGSLSNPVLVSFPNLEDAIDQLLTLIVRYDG